MLNEEKKDVRCPTCAALLFKTCKSWGSIEIKCRHCKKIVEVKLNAKSISKNSQSVASIDVK